MPFKIPHLINFLFNYNRLFLFGVTSHINSEIYMNFAFKLTLPYNSKSNKSQDNSPKIILT